MLEYLLIITKHNLNLSPIGVSLIWQVFDHKQKFSDTLTRPYLKFAWLKSLGLHIHTNFTE